MSGALQLGPFEVGEQIGAGGSGVVYRARHLQSGEPVALKVCRDGASPEPAARRRFRREARALARLHHPRIAVIVDYGEVDAGARRGDAGFAEGAPWFAMEYVDASPLHRADRDWTWEALQRFLEAVLEALAHAHARSVVHRDLKPSNILVESGEEPIEERTHLVDFGIARVFDRERVRPGAGENAVVGTPEYMAPEQIRGDWRDQGPWTDLYALGCLAWRIVCGSGPVEGETTREVLLSHMRKELPEFVPRFDVPEGLEEWLRGLLGPSIDRRFRRAAEARRTLCELESTAPPRELRPCRRGRVASRRSDEAAGAGSRVDGAEEGATTRTTVVVEERSGGLRVTRSAEEARAAEVPPIPEHWERPEGQRRTSLRPGAGLELFALREIPFVDREEERDRLWARLKRVAKEREPALVAIEGGPGTGKSRLAQWLCRRVRELGAATVLEIEHGASAEPGAGLRGMVRRIFRTAGLERGEVFQRLAERLPTAGPEDSMRIVDARGLTELLRPTADDGGEAGGPGYRFSSPDQLHALLRRLFVRLATRRPLVCWFDDLQWGRETLGLLEYLYERPEDLPPLFAVATIRSDILADERELRGRLDSLIDAADATRIELDPLSRGDHRELVDRMLRLEEGLAERLAGRTEGHPMFAVELLRDWVERDVLERGDRGFRLGERAEIEVPDDLQRLWLDRLRGLATSLSEADGEAVWRALERAAVLGREIRDAEWKAIRRDVGLADAGALRDGLLERGLAEHTERGWAFVHGLLVESIQQRAEEEGRLQSHHRRSAKLLERLHRDRRRQTASRRADHWVEAGEPGRAIDPLREESERLKQLGQLERTKSALERRGRLLERAEVSEDDPAKIRNDLDLLLCELRLGRPPGEIEGPLERTRERARKCEDEASVARAWRFLAECRRTEGALVEAAEAAESALRAARRAEDSLELVEALNKVGGLQSMRGALGRAEEVYEEATARAAESGDSFRETVVRRGLAWVALKRGERERARDLYRETLDRSREAGYRWEEAAALNGLGELARFEGDVERARTCYRKVHEVTRELNRPIVAVVTRLNLGLVELMAGRFDVAAGLLEEARREHEAIGHGGEHERLFRLARLVIEAGEGSWREFDERLGRIADSAPTRERVESDHAWLLELAGDYARGAGEGARARRCWAWARELWTKLDVDEPAERLASKIADAE